MDLKSHWQALLLVPPSDSDMTASRLADLRALNLGTYMHLSKSFLSKVKVQSLFIQKIFILILQNIAYHTSFDPSHNKTMGPTSFDPANMDEDEDQRVSAYTDNCILSLLFYIK